MKKRGTSMAKRADGVAKKAMQAQKTWAKKVGKI